MSRRRWKQILKELDCLHISNTKVLNKTNLQQYLSTLKTSQKKPKPGKSQKKKKKKKKIESTECGSMTEGRNHTAIQEFRCRTGQIEIHQKIIFSAMNIPLCSTAFLGNVLILVALQKVSSLHPPSKLLLGCLASSDLCVGLVTQPLYISFLMIPGHFRLCHYLNFASFILGILLCGVSLLTLTAISVDRLLALLLGLRYRPKVTLRRVWILVASLWISSVALAMTSFYNVRITAGITGVILLSCVATSSCCYVKIYFTLHHHQAQIGVHVHQQNEGRIPLNVARYRNTVCTALCMQISLIACYLPYGIVSALRAVTGLSLYLAWDVALSLIFFNSTLNPILYCWRIRQVREEVKNTIKQLCRLSS